jgi:hypothetical protein
MATYWHEQETNLCKENWIGVHDEGEYPMMALWEIIFV